MSAQDSGKKAAAKIAASWVPNGIRIGLGSGSTIAFFIEYLGERVRSEKLQIVGVPTSEKSAHLARQVGIPLIEPQRGLTLDLTVDGADEIAPDLTLVKGGGGALLREKVIAAASKYLLIIADGPSGSVGRATRDS